MLRWDNTEQCHRRKVIQQYFNLSFLLMQWKKIIIYKIFFLVQSNYTSSCDQSKWDIFDSYKLMFIKCITMIMIEVCDRIAITRGSLLPPTVVQGQLFRYVVISCTREVLSCQTCYTIGYLNRALSDIIMRANWTYNLPKDHFAGSRHIQDTGQSWPSTNKENRAENLLKKKIK